MCLTGMVLVSEVCVWGLVEDTYIPLLIEELSCKLLSSHMHETLHQSTHSSPHGTMHDLQKQHTNLRDAEPAVWPHPLTFEPFGIDLFDEVGVDVSCYELGLGDDVPQHWDVVVDTCGRGRAHAVSAIIIAVCMFAWTNHLH